MFLCRHPENPRIFCYENRPCVLVTAGEHYGGWTDCGIIPGGEVTLDIPDYERDIALRLDRVDE